MTTASGAFSALKTRLTGGGSGISVSMYWQGEHVVLPDTPTAFAYMAFENFGSRRFPAAYGGGSGSNLYRNEGLLTAYVFAPNRQGIAVAMDIAETIAARARSYRSADVSCFAADVTPVGDGAGIAPPGLRSEVNQYQCALAEISFMFDQIG
jgi:hypothetical protein